MNDQKIPTSASPYLIPPGTITFPLCGDWTQEGGIGGILSTFLRPQIGPRHVLFAYEPRYSRIEKKTRGKYQDYHGKTHTAEEISYRVIAERDNNMFWMQYTEIQMVEDGVTYAVPRSYIHYPH